MDINQAFGIALRELRESKGLTQEKLSGTVTRPYISILERGLKSPTLSLIEKLAHEMDTHPVILLLSAYTKLEGDELESLKKLIQSYVKGMK